MYNTQCVFNRMHIIAPFHRHWIIWATRPHLFINWLSSNLSFSMTLCMPSIRNSYRRCSRNSKCVCKHETQSSMAIIESVYPYYNLPYNPSAPFVRSGFLVFYRIRSAMKFPQNVLHYIWHTSRVYVIHIKSLSRYFQLTQNWTDKAKWRSICLIMWTNIQDTGCWLLTRSPPNKFRFI